MADEFNMTRDVPLARRLSTSSLNCHPQCARLDLAPREPHLYDYLLILRKHQWLILSFMLAVVTIVRSPRSACGLFMSRRRASNWAERTPIFFRSRHRFLRLYARSRKLYRDTVEDFESETLALQTIRSGIITGVSGAESQSDAIATGSLANQKRPPELARFSARSASNGCPTAA